MINPIPDDQVPWLIGAFVVGVLWVAAVPIAARWLLKRPPLRLSLPGCIAAAVALAYVDPPAPVPFIPVWFALPVVMTVAAAALARALRLT